MSAPPLDAVRACAPIRAAQALREVWAAASTSGSEGFFVQLAEWEVRQLV
jgi:frataxin-like iron-binding protein CyaY